jgi:hypothetical protein
MTHIHCKDSQDSGRHPHGTGDMQGYGEVVRERTPSHGKERLYKHSATMPRHQRTRHLCAMGKQHQLHKEIN